VGSCVINFAVAYRDNQIDKTQIIESMIPFYHARVLSFVNRTETYGVKEAEEYLENINHIFETEKYYLQTRWDASRKSIGTKLFK